MTIPGHSIPPRDANPVARGIAAPDSLTEPDATASTVVARLAGAGLTLGTCESLTGGGIAQAITSVSGASAVFRGGLVTYASDLKTSLAGVDPACIERDGVVNEYTAAAMATGARRVLVTDIAVACTGVAGPDPQDGEAPGTVWIALAGPGRDELVVRALDLDGDRAAVRLGTATAVFALICEVLAKADSIKDH